MDQQTIDKTIEKIEESEYNPLVKRVLKQETTLSDEIHNFYNVENKTQKTKKIGTYPKDLIEIISNINGSQYRITKLKYESVRDDYQRWNSKSRSTIRIILGLGVGQILTAAALTFCFVAYEEQNLIPTISYGIAGVSSAIVGFKALLWYPDPKGTNHEYQEYNNFSLDATFLDNFIKDHYRTYFIKKTFENKK